MSDIIIREINKRRCLIKETTRDTYSPDIRKWLKENGNKKIKNIAVCRTPVESYIRNTLNIISLGKFNKNLKTLNYDDIFHLYLLISLEDGQQYILEKNEVIQKTKVDYKVQMKRKNQVCMKIPLKKNIREKIVRKQNPRRKFTGQLTFGQSNTRTSYINKTYIINITLQQLMDRASNNRGKSFYSYHPQKNNCQVFVETLLLASDLIRYNDNTHRFIKQDGNEIFKDIKYVSIFGKRLTDLAHTIDILKLGC